MDFMGGICFMGTTDIIIITSLLKRYSLRTCLGTSISVYAPHALVHMHCTVPRDTT
jgi:hypothetical protein